MSTDSSLSSSGIPRIPLLYTGILRYTSYSLSLYNLNLYTYTPYTHAYAIPYSHIHTPYSIHARRSTEALS